MYKIKLKIKKCKNINDLRKFIGEQDIKLILFGEYHGFVNQIKIQKEIIKKVKPDFFLYEMLEENKIMKDEDINEFLNKPDNKNFSVVSTYGQLKPMIKLAQNFNLSIIGCDIKNMAVNKDWRKKKFSREESKKIIKKRELRQAEMINKFTSKGLVFTILGVHHLRKNSFLWSKLKNKKVIIIKPAFKWEERFNDSKKFNKSEIYYVIKMISL